MEMKLVQYIVTLVAVKVVVEVVVLARQAIRVQMNCAPCILMDQRHKMALDLGVSW